MTIASMLLSSRIRRKSDTVFGGVACSFETSPRALASTRESTSHRYPTVVFVPAANAWAGTIPRPLSPITATLSFSAGEPSKAKRGPAPREAANAPRLAADARFRKSRRSSESFGVMDYSGLQRPNLDVAEEDFVDVVLENDVSGAPRREIRNAAVFARREERIHSRCTELELDDFLSIEPVLAVIPAEYDHRAVPLPDGL